MGVDGMRFVLTLVFWLVLVGIGLLIGDRYGAPTAITGLTDGVFEAIESQAGGGDTGEEATPEAE